MKIVIAGQSKSGTTALFYRIRNSLSGSVLALFEPDRFKPALLPQRHVLAKVLITPALDGASFDHFDKKILIVRDPRDNLISTLLYGSIITDISSDPDRLERFLDALRRKESDSAAVSVHELTVLIEELYPHFPLYEYWRKICQLSMDFASAHPDYHIIKYEDFIDGSFRSLEEYLGFSLSGDARVGSRHQRVARTKRYGDWRNWFEPDDIAFFRPAMLPFMKQYGYDDDWSLDGKQPIVPEHASAYVQRIIAEKQERDRCVGWVRPVLRRIRALLSGR